MRALTLTQPWAQLVAFAVKRWETRSWGTKYRGPLLIHAAFRFPNPARALCDREPWARLLRYRATAALPRGQVVAVADLVGCGQLLNDRLVPDPAGLRRWGVRPMLPNEPAAMATVTPEEELVGDWRPGRWIWELTNVRELAHPVPAVGKLGLWKVDAALEASVLADARLLATPPTQTLFGFPVVEMPEPRTREPRMCQACTEGDHANCGMQTWCECDCPGRDGDYDDEGPA